ncbi:MAG: hypothetical protein ACLR8P_19070 [Clostridium fessum]
MGLVAFIMAYALFAFIFYILQVIAYWKIFTKAGEEGWKSIIPIYNGYVQYRPAWDVQYFWVALGLAVGGGILNSSAESCGVIGSLLRFWEQHHECGGTLYKLACAYGHGIGFTIGLFFLNPLLC